jgi:hypothetical protein
MKVMINPGRDDEQLNLRGGARVHGQKYGQACQPIRHLAHSSALSLEFAFALLLWNRFFK